MWNEGGVAIQSIRWSHDVHILWREPCGDYLLAQYPGRLVLVASAGHQYRQVRRPAAACEGTLDCPGPLQRRAAVSRHTVPTSCRPTTTLAIAQTGS